MFDMKITGLTEASLFAWWATKTISTVSTEVKHKGNDIHLIVYMSDITEEKQNHIHPQRHHVNDILDFTKDLNDDDRLLVHCHQGMSRSTATAIGIVIQHGLSIEEAFAHVLKIRPMMLPNTLILKHMDDALKLDGKLYDYGVKWVDEKKNKTEDVFERARSHPTAQNMEAMREYLKLLK
jgi:predicted protein tyrosine phosphatase